MSAFNLFGKKKKKEEKPEKKEEAKKVISQKVQADGSALAYSVIISQHITEKASDMVALNKYVFKVFKDANKKRVKDAVENLYDVTVASVQIINIPSKKIRVGRFEGKKSGYKKAIVTLRKGDKIETAPH